MSPNQKAIMLSYELLKSYLKLFKDDYTELKKEYPSYLSRGNNSGL